MVAAVLLQAALAFGPVGVILAVDDPGARVVFRESLEAQFSRGVVWSCREAAVCLEIVAVPIVFGKTTSGWAVAARVSRRLEASAEWPEGFAKQEPHPQAPAVEIIEDTTASGEVACAPCEEAKAQCHQELKKLAEFARGRFEDVGGLFLRVGPGETSFLRQTALDLGAQLQRVLTEGGSS